MDTDHETDIDELFPADDADTDDGDTVADGEAEEPDGEEEEWDALPGNRGGKTAKPASSPLRKRSKPDIGCLAGAALLLAIILMFGWVIIGAIVDVAKENREAELQRWKAAETYRQSVAQRSSGSSSYSGSKSGSGSSGSSYGSSSYGSSGSTYKPKQSSGGDRKDEYNAADFRNAEDFYDEHYDDFFDYYDAEDYWNEHN